MPDNPGGLERMRWRILMSAGLSLILIASLFWGGFGIDWSAALADPRWEFFALAAGLLAALPVLEAARISVLAARPFDEMAGVIGVNAAAAALAQAPFGLIGAEIYRGHAYHRRGVPLAAIVTALTLARGLGVAALVIAAGVAGAQTAASSPAGWVQGAGLAILSIIIALAASVALARRFAASDPVTRRGKLVQALARLTTAQLALASLISLVIVAVRAFALLASAASLGWSIGPAAAVIASAIALLIALIPVASGVLGVREGGVAGALALAGLPLAAGIAVGFTFRFAALIGALLAMALARAAGWDRKP